MVVKYKLSDLSKDLKAINIKYISFVIARDDMVSVSELGNLGFVNLQQYYFCAFCVLIVILLVLCFSIIVDLFVNHFHLAHFHGSQSI